MALQFAESTAGKLVAASLVLVLAFFMQNEKERIIEWIRGFFPRSALRYIDHKSMAIHTKIGQWARGLLTLALSIFALTFIALSILGMPYALTLALFAGFCEMIPVVGPFIAAVPAVLIAITQEGFLWAVVVGCVYYAIQWSENNLLVPLIMNKAVGLSPIAILFAIMVAVSFSPTIPPVLGVILAIPTTTVISIFLSDWSRVKRSR